MDLPSPFLFSPLYRMVPCKKGMYCIRCILPLQVECPVSSCGQPQIQGQLEECNVLGGVSMPSAQNLNGVNQSSAHLWWTINTYSIISLLCNRVAASTNSCFK